MNNITTRILIITAGAIAVSALGIAAFAGNPTSAKKSTPSADQADLVARGRYLVHGIGFCVDCHSPRNERGEFLENKHLTGAPIVFKPTIEMPWMPAAPRIAGLPAGYTVEDMVHFLMTGERPHSLPPVLPPMPPYRMNRDDAEAVVAYVRTLPTGLE